MCLSGGRKRKQQRERERESEIKQEGRRGSLPAAAVALTECLTISGTEPFSKHVIVSDKNDQGLSTSSCHLCDNKRTNIM